MSDPKQQPAEGDKPKPPAPPGNNDRFEWGPDDIEIEEEPDGS